ncbi:MAG: hypothetical protein KAJ49_09560 [Arcobacteraceae bacterium]|nr:hypothetical protein [Arcobacteraceae bacterium]
MVECKDIKTIEDVTAHWSYLDAIGLGDRDNRLVACGQDTDSNGYNELKDKYTKYYSQYAEADVAKAMCACCKEKNSSGLAHYASGSQWEQFYKCMENKGFLKK